MNLISPSFREVGEPNIEFKSFPDGDSYVKVNDLSSFAGEEVRFFHRLYPSQNDAIFRSLLILDVLKRVGARVEFVCPYLPYSRQDKTFLEGEALSAQVLCNLLAGFGVKKLITVDCHFLKNAGEFEYSGLKIKNLSANKEIVEYVRKKISDEIEIISPDQGANYLVSAFGGRSMNKVRGEYENEGEQKESAYRKIKTMEMDFSVKDKNILILDDMISTGGTMIKAVENVKKGGAKKIICAATHGFFLNNSLEKLAKIADEVVTTNSIPNPTSKIDIVKILELG